MPYAIDETHDPNLESWVESANDPTTDFPIQNLPLCYAMGGFMGPAVRIGDSFADIGALAELASKHGMLNELLEAGVDAPIADAMKIFGMPAKKRHALRRAVSYALSTEFPAIDEAREEVFHVNECDSLPLAYHPKIMFEGGTTMSDYTDFYASVYHATNVGSM
ncbi:MAG: hypothetical protein AAFN41_01840, partial [Planctomycetota bacterium]